MTTRLQALCFDANDPELLARFWAGVLRLEIADDPSGGKVLPPREALGFPLRFLPVPNEKWGHNQAHFDLTSATAEEQQETVARALELGARHHDVGPDFDEPHVVLEDPEGNEFCVIEAGNNFLANTGFIGALSSDGTPEVGYFWSKALDWPLVWDQDEETAIQSPTGGSKISWGGPPYNEKLGRNRLHLDLAPPAGGDVRAEADRLVALGAALVGEVDGGFELTDPDGNEFRVVAG
ncbi:VOC family protein [Kribbella italica]|uniref:Catechol 2,3-dioxygenase-like lactoylglutathione lyase family enzyme n=1 Tax=Kribbella italica TaxID=1540520 RepID=A0A7W9J4H3_9ACTN|nr:VOC family protein [Kribbella italica]MBB5835220.1 catechol 2,3-dioxygenase-like lactoylglutathione lyase family enzyme [Kribbella italica]